MSFPIYYETQRVNSRNKIYNKGSAESVTLFRI